MNFSADDLRRAAEALKNKANVGNYQAPKTPGGGPTLTVGSRPTYNPTSPPNPGLANSVSPAPGTARTIPKMEKAGRFMAKPVRALGAVGEAALPVMLGKDAYELATNEKERQPYIDAGQGVADRLGPAVGAAAASLGGAVDKIGNVMTLGGLHQGYENIDKGKYNIVEGGNVAGDLVNNAANVFGGIGDAILGMPKAIYDTFTTGSGTNLPSSTAATDPKSNPKPTPVAPATPTVAPLPQTQAERIAVANVPQGRNVITGDAASTAPGVATGEVFVSKGSRPGGGMEARRYAVDGVKGSASGITATGGPGGFIGSGTDAEAARNLQARAEQNQAAQFNVDSMNRAAEAERDTRAAKLGVSRGVLDRMEGRDTSAGRAALAAQTAPDTSAPGVWDRPGDSFGDAAMREAQFNSTLDDAGNQRGWGAKRRAAAKLQAATSMLQPGMAAVEADTAQRKSAAGLQAAQFNSLTDLQKAQMQEAGQNQRAQATNATTLGAARIAQAGGLAREGMQQEGQDAREGAKLRQANSKEVIDYLTKATFADGKNPPVVTQQDIEATLNELNPAAINAAGGGSVEDIAALRAGRIPDVATAQKLVAIAQQRRQGTPGLWGRMIGNEAPNATDLFLNQAGYMKNWQEKQRAN